MEKALREEFLPYLFLRAAEHMSKWKVMRFPAKNAGLKIPDPTLTSQGNWNVSCMVTGHLIADLRGYFEFLSGDHGQLPTNDRAEIWRWKGKEAEEALSDEVRGLSLMEGHRLRRGRKTGAWLSVAP